MKLFSVTTYGAHKMRDPAARKISLADIVECVTQEQASLFYGSGVTLDCGGPDWKELFSNIKSRFPEGESDNFFEYMDQIIGFDDSNRATVEEFLRNKLASIAPKGNQKYLFSIPWKAVLTTNYDDLPDLTGRTLDGKRMIVPIVDPSDQTDQSREDHLYCFKLLGDQKRSYPHGGWMVLSMSDLFSAALRRKIFFAQFNVLASSGHIVYLGYSFEDDLVFRLLKQMKIELGRFPWKGFAVTPSKPAPAIKRKLDSVGISWVKGTLDEFIVAAKKVFGDCPPSAPTGSGFLNVRGEVVELDQSILAYIWNKFSVLDSRLLRGTETPEDFLRGICKSFHPYASGYDFPRKTRVLHKNQTTDVHIPSDLSEMKYKVKTVEVSQNAFVALCGIAGSGKTVVANRLAFDWYQSGNPVIFVNPESATLEVDALDSLFGHVGDQYLSKAEKSGKSKPSSLRWLIVADDCGPMLSELKALRNRLRGAARPADILLVTRETETPIGWMIGVDVDAIYRLDDTVSDEERDDFIKHFVRFGVLDQDTLLRNLHDPEINRSFFGLIYSSIRHSRENIRTLLEEEYRRLDSKSQRFYRTAALIQSFRLRPWLSLILKSLEEDQMWLAQQVKQGSLGGVLQLGDFGRSLLTQNRIVAEAISEIAFKTSEERKLALKNVISSVTMGDLTEMLFLENLLNRRIELGIGPIFSIEDKIDLFREGVDVVKSRPLLIHKARLETNAKKFPEARKSLRAAIDACVPGFEERIEHVKDAEGRLEHALAESKLELGERDSAWDYLDKAEEKFSSAKIDPKITPHPYEGLGRTYVAKARMTKEPELQWGLLLAAIQECNYVEKYLGRTVEISLVKLEVQERLTTVGFDESYIQRLTSDTSKAIGYAYLAEIEFGQKRWREALDFVIKGLKLDGKNIWLLRLHVMLLRRLRPDDHDQIMSTLRTYSEMASEQYDIELSLELAKETYISGKVGKARALFHDLDRRARHHPRRLLHRDRVDRWFQKGRPMRLNGTITKMPTELRRGLVTTTFPGMFRDTIPVRKRGIPWRGARVGQRVSYEVVFNMNGPEASRIRPL